MANALADLLNGLNNSAASTVSAPVDGISWLLRKAGMGNVIGKAPVGGSAWMQQQGLTRPTNGLAGDVGEFAGNLLPIAAAAKAPQIAAAANKVVGNALAPSTLNPQLGAIVYHGSPHSFDAFDMSKIGTGEGAQAYGHGLYFADHPETARTYSADRAYVGAAMNGKPAAINYDDPAWIAQKTMDELGDPAKAKAHLEMVARTAAKHQTPESAAAVKGAIDLISAGKVGTKGNLYKVDLPDEAIAKMLDWDKPLSQQPHVVSALEKAGIFTGERRTMGPVGDQWEAHVGPGGTLMNTNQTGGGLVGAFSSDSHSRALFSDDLRKAGVPGIRYLDGGSRTAGQGTSNYVVFDDQLPKILERNGKSIAEQFADKYK